GNHSLQPDQLGKRTGYDKRSNQRQGTKALCQWRSRARRRTPKTCRRALVTCNVHSPVLSDRRVVLYWGCRILSRSRCPEHRVCPGDIQPTKYVRPLVCERRSTLAESCESQSMRRPMPILSID